MLTSSPTKERPSTVPPVTLAPAATDDVEVVERTVRVPLRAGAAVGAAVAVAAIVHSVLAGRPAWSLALMVVYGAPACTLLSMGITDRLAALWARATSRRRAGRVTQQRHVPRARTARRTAAHRR